MESEFKKCPICKELLGEGKICEVIGNDETCRELARKLYEGEIDTYRFAVEVVTKLGKEKAKKLLQVLENILMELEKEES